MKAAVFALCVFASSAFAATAWQPTHTVEIIVSTSPGSGSDRAARLIQKLLTEDGEDDRLQRLGRRNRGASGRTHHRVGITGIGGIGACDAQYKAMAASLAELGIQPTMR